MIEPSTDALKLKLDVALRLRGRLVRTLVSSKLGPALRQRTLERLEDLDREIAILRERLTPDAQVNLTC
jgi:hypothetical protein